MGRTFELVAMPQEEFENWLKEYEDEGFDDKVRCPRFILEQEDEACLKGLLEAATVKELD